jgi:hypothetical protein
VVITQDTRDYWKSTITEAIDILEGERGSECDCRESYGRAYDALEALEREEEPDIFVGVLDWCEDLTKAKGNPEELEDAIWSYDYKAFEQ